MENNKIERLEHYLARALGLLKKDCPENVNTKKVVVSNIETYFKEKEICDGGLDKKI